MDRQAMTTEHAETFLQVLCDATRAIGDSYGLTEAQATEMADALTRHIQQRFGGERVYVHAKRQQDTKRRILVEFDGRNRDELCAKYGISRAWFYRLAGDR